MTSPNAPARSFYMLLIANYSGDVEFFNLILNPKSTTTTDCSITCDVDFNLDATLSSGSSYTLRPTFTGIFNAYERQNDVAVIAGETGPSLTVTDSGTYKLKVIALDVVFG